MVIANASIGPGWKMEMDWHAVTCGLTYDVGQKSLMQSGETLGPAHTTPRGVGLMAWAIRRSVFSSHA